MIFTLTMLRRRNNSRRVSTTKQPPSSSSSSSSSLMADQSKPNTCHPSSSSSSSSSLFTSPKFRFFTSKFDTDFSLISPTSTLEANSSIFSSSFKNNPKPKFQPPEDESFLNGLADLVKNQEEEDQQNLKKQVNKKVLFGSKLRVQIPSTDFGTKTGLRYPCYGGQISPCIQTKVLTGGSTTIPDQTEDYTRVISHGPNPTITHIFDNFVFIESKPLPLAMEIKKKNFKKTDDFFSYCYTCKKNLLDHKQDIYIYRGEKGFCSSECRYQEMLIDQMES